MGIFTKNGQPYLLPSRKTRLRNMENQRTSRQKSMDAQNGEPTYVTPKITADQNWQHARLAQKCKLNKTRLENPKAQKQIVPMYNSILNRLQPLPRSPGQSWTSYGAMGENLSKKTR